MTLCRYHVLGRRLKFIALVDMEAPTLTQRAFTITLELRQKLGGSPSARLCGWAVLRASRLFERLAVRDALRGSQLVAQVDSSLTSVRFCRAEYLCGYMELPAFAL